ncbi:hypothetical protein EJ02DRAFT_453640 [Clathrospora elynae]|uniref:Uncharacterized protein n=1 Tax=Clathrospora elynae TaxID=706981 RepID=A0A6A5STG4_9PLEO|nr:hypothetical protein EJ02DRAFT_453640 [Clathrospora elynae]
MPPPPPPPPNAFFETVLNTNLNPHPSSSPDLAADAPPPQMQSPNTSRTVHRGQEFTATQRGAQARGKGNNVGGGGEEGYEARQLRDQAVGIVESEEMLMWFAAARNESIPQTRHHYLNIVLGLTPDPEDIAWRDEWEVPLVGRAGGGERSTVASPARSAKGKEREIARVKKRISSVHTHA